jgi:phospho-N-acetylmuramoyl-pentapeptide-transferase
MLFWLQERFQDDLSPLRVFGYVTFRTVGALLTALLLTMVLYPKFIKLLRQRQIGESIRSDGPESHQEKTGTPTMGGILIIFTVTVCVALWGNLENVFVRCTTLLFLGFGLIGFADDYVKLHKIGGKSGLPGKFRLLLEFLVTGSIIAFFLNYGAEHVNTTRLYIPFISADRFHIALNPWVYGAFASFLIVATANAVNLTDGLDGLAIGPTVVSAFTFLILAYLTSATLALALDPASAENLRTATCIHGFDVNTLNVRQICVAPISEYLLLPEVPGVQELTIFAAALVGAGIGFLWYNTFPASIFMGDVGALAMGAALGALAVFTKNELLSAIIHGLFLLEAVSVIVQTTSYKLTGRRVFRMAPIHHHFEMKGWPEPKIIVRFWIISIMLALIALSSLKLR